MDDEQKKWRIECLKKELRDTDYKTLKYNEGQLSEEEWRASNAIRQAIRLEIEELEKELSGNAKG